MNFHEMVDRVQAIVKDPALPKIPNVPDEPEVPKEFEDILIATAVANYIKEPTSE